MNEALHNRYRQKSKKEITAEAKKIIAGALPEKISEGVAGTILLAAGLKDSGVTRRKVLKVAGLLAAAGVAEVGKGLSQGNVFNLLGGQLSDPEEQRILTALSSTTGWTLSDKPTMLWVNARTAMAVEKAQQIAEHPSQTVSHSPIQIDLLYGSMHAANLPRIMIDQAYRHKVITDYLRDLLSQVDITVTSQKMNIAQYKNELLKAAAKSILSYKIEEVHMPWGQRIADTFDQSEFEQKLTTTKVSGESQSLKPVVTSVLREFGIND